MNYLSKRVNGLKAIGTFHPIEGQVWRMLIIALLLGSKFLDDNTFQNRTWSEVSGISVAELNKLEADWLVGIDWNLYVNLERSEGYNAWLDNWGQWIYRKKMAQTLASRERLAALVPTDFLRPRNQAYGTHLPPARAPEADVWNPGLHVVVSDVEAEVEGVVLQTVISRLLLRLQTMSTQAILGIPSSNATVLLDKRNLIPRPAGVIVLPKASLICCILAKVASEWLFKNSIDAWAVCGTFRSRL
jgi:hypothetical protein